MKTKLLYGVVTVLLAATAYLKIQNYSKDSKITDLESTVFEMQENIKKDLKKIRDSALSESTKAAKKSKKSFDSILNIPLTIKYVRYEEKVYANRNLDDALRVHSEYKRSSNKGSKEFN